jgi:hypothetical protein
MTFTNEGVLDRMLRILVGSSLAYVAWITWPGAAAIVLLLISGIAVVTGLTGLVSALQAVPHLHEERNCCLSRPLRCPR